MKHKDTQRKGHVRTEAETGVMCLQAKEYHELPETARSKGKGIPLIPKSLRKEPVLTTP